MQQTQALDNLYDLTEADRIKRGINSLPSNLKEALDFTKESEFVREALGEDALANGGNEARERFEVTVDRMALKSFDYYIECRERIHHVKEDELKRNLHMILRQANALERRDG